MELCGRWRAPAGVSMPNAPGTGCQVHYSSWLQIDLISWVTVWNSDPTTFNDQFSINRHCVALDTEDDPVLVVCYGICDAPLVVCNSIRCAWRVEEVEPTVAVVVVRYRNTHLGCGYSGGKYGHDEGRGMTGMHRYPDAAEERERADADNNDFERLHEADLTCKAVGGGASGLNNELCRIRPVRARASRASLSTLCSVCR